MLRKERKSVNQRVFIAEESPHMLMIVGGHAFETVCGHLTIFLHQRLRDDEFLHSVLTGILKHELSYHAVLNHCPAHLKSGVDEDSVVATEHLGVHPAHRRTDDKVGTLALTHPAKHRHSVCRHYGNILGYHTCRREERLKYLDRICGSSRTKAMHIHYGFSYHNIRVGFHKFAIHAIYFYAKVRIIFQLK